MAVTKTQLHRTIGVISAGFLILLILSGLLLQHSQLLSLDKKYLPAPLAELFYGVGIYSSLDYQVGSNWLSHAGQWLYFNGQQTMKLSGMRAAISCGNYIAVAGNQILWLLSQQGERLDKLTISNGLPGIIGRLGCISEQRLVISGTYQSWRASEDFYRWQPYNEVEGVTWSEPSFNLPTAMRNNVLDHAQSYSVTWERLLFDLHSGRIFGLFGVLIVDLATILLLLVAITGILLWTKR